ncbi:hypothetical protein D3C80_1850070 [compost metagenome]
MRLVGLLAKEEEGQGAWYDVLVDVQLAMAPSRLRLGMTAQLSVVVHRSEAGMVVPAEALQEDETGRAYVIFRREGEPSGRRVPVTVGITVAQGVEVEGLEAGFVQVQ